MPCPEVDSRGVQEWVNAHNVLLDGGSFRGGEVLIFGLEAQRAKGRKHLWIFLDRERRGMDELEILIHGNRKRVFVEF